MGLFANVRAAERSRALLKDTAHRLKADAEVILHFWQAEIQYGTIQRQTVHTYRIQKQCWSLDASL